MDRKVVKSVSRPWSGNNVYSEIACILDMYVYHSNYLCHNVKNYWRNCHKFCHEEKGFFIQLYAQRYNQDVGSQSDK